MNSFDKPINLPSSFLRKAAVLGGLLFSISPLAGAQTTSAGIMINNGNTYSYENYEITTTGTQSGIKIQGGSTLYLDYDSVLKEPKGTATTIKVTSGNGVHGLYVTGSNSTLVAANTSIDTSGATNSHAIYTDSATGKIVLYNIGTLTASGRGIAAGGGQIRLNIDDSGSAWESAQNTIIRSTGYGVAASSNGQVNLAHVAEITTASVGLWANSSSSIRLNVDGSGNPYAGVPQTVINSSSYGMQVDTSSSIVADNVSITTNGDNAYGLYANGNVSTKGNITLSNAIITTLGISAHGVYANGGIVSITNGSISTTGYGLFAQGATGVIVIDNTEITSTGAGVYAGAGSKIWINTNTAGTSTGMSSTISTNSIGLFASAEGSRITAANLGLTVTGATGVLANSGGMIYLTGGSINVQGGGNYVHGISVDNGSMSMVDGTVTVTNSFGYGLYAKNAAGVVVMDGTDISSTGVGAYVDTGGKIWINVHESGGISEKSSTLTANNLAGLYAGASSQIVAANLELTTTGTNSVVHGAYAKAGSISIVDSIIKTTGTGGYGLYAASSGSVVADGTNVESLGIGAYAEGGGQIWINMGTDGVATGKSSTIVTTNAVGLFATGTNSQITSANLVINAQGGANAVEASGRNSIYLTGGSITTQGRAVNALGGSLISLNGTQVYLNGANTRGLHANQSTVNATGVTVRASQAGIQAVCAYSSGQLSLIDSNVIINGATSFGLYANSGTISVQGSSIYVAESGTGSHAIGAVTGGVVNINGGVTVLTEAEKSYGIYASSSSGTATINVNEPISITTTYEGNPNNWNNSLWMNASYGIFGDAGAQITLSKGGTISTKGYFANAINANGANGSFTANNVILTTQGGYAAGAYVRAGTALTLNNATISTTGVGASGIVISGSSSLSLGGANSIQTSGVGAHGFSAVWGANFTLGDSTTLLPSIALNGTDSALVYVTGGEFTHTAEIKPSTLTLNGINLGRNNTLAAGNWGAKAENSGTLIFSNGSGTGSTGLWATGVADYSYFVNPTDDEPVHTGPLYGTIVFKDSSRADGSLVRLDAYGILDIVGTDSGLNVGALNGSGSVKLGDKNLTIGGYTTAADFSNSEFNGDIFGDLGGIIKTGNSSFTLNGGHGTYTGGTTSIVDGTLNIINGGTISDNEGRIGKSGGSTIVSGYVDGVGSLWSNSGNLYVGENGNASLSIINGGTVVSQETFFNPASQSNSVMLIQGQAQGNRSVLITGGLSKSSGSGKANVTIDGGELRATRNNGQFISGFDSASVTVGNNGAYINTQQYNVGVRAESFYGSGTILKTGSGVLAMSGTGYTNTANGIALHVQQGVFAAASMSADGSTLSISTFSTNGNVVFGDGTAYRVLIGQNSTVNSSVNLKGSGTFQVGSNVGLILDVDSGYSAQEGDYFDIASGLSGTAIGAFTIPESGVLIGGMNFDVLYGDSYIRLQAVPEPSTYALIAGVAALGISIIRRKKRNAAK